MRKTQKMLEKQTHRAQCERNSQLTLIGDVFCVHAAYRPLPKCMGCRMGIGMEQESIRLKWRVEQSAEWWLTRKSLIVSISG